MDDDKGYTIYCTRCGAVMNSNSRYCMKCGNLNYEHEANKNMRQFMKQDNGQKYEVGAGNFMNNNTSEIKTSIATNTGNVFLCFILSYFIYLLLFLGIGYYFYQMCEGNLLLLINTSFPIIGIIISIVSLYYFSLEQIYIKCNRRWWSAFIPIYDNMVLADIAFNNMLLGLLPLIPVVGSIYLLYLYYKLGKDFSYNGILVLLFPFIYLPLMGLGTHTYRGYTFLSDEGSISVEKNYKYRRTFVITCVIVIVGCIGSILYTYKDKVAAVKAQNYYYVMAGKKIINKTRNVIETEKNYTCSNNNGIYYFVYNDFGKVIHLPFDLSREAIRGYVKVDTTSGSTLYYVTLTDGEKGFYEVLESDINKDVVTDYEYFDYYELSNVCEIKEKHLLK